jgi:hypothetical protein
MQDLDQAIRERAYQLWMESGRDDGKADHHWLAAQREILSASLWGLGHAASRKAKKNRKACEGAAETARYLGNRERITRNCDLADREPTAFSRSALVSFSTGYVCVAYSLPSRTRIHAAASRSWLVKASQIPDPRRRNHLKAIDREAMGRTTGPREGCLLQDHQERHRGKDSTDPTSEVVIRSVQLEFEILGSVSMARPV